MRIVRRAFAVVVLLAGAGVATRAQDQPPALPAGSVPTTVGRSIARGVGNANVVPSSFRAHLVVDDRFAKNPPPKDDTERDPRDRTGKIHCLVCENGLSPVVAIFVRPDVSKLQKTDGLSKLINGVDALIPTYRSDKLSAFAMFLRLEAGKKPVPSTDPETGAPKNVEVDLEYPHDENRAAKVTEVQTYANVLGAKNVPLGLAAEKSVGLDAFAIGDATPVTVIIYNRLRIARRWELKMDELTDERIAEILAETEAMIRGKRAVVQQ